MAQDEDYVNELISRFGFAAAGENKAIGEISAIPATITIIGVDPLAIMWRLRIGPNAENTAPLLELFDDAPSNFASVSVEEGSAWISLYDLSEVDHDNHCEMMEKIAALIHSCDLALPAGCFRCGCVEKSNLMLVDNNPTRLCEECFREADQERHRLDVEINSASWTRTLQLPGVMTIVAATWALFWFGVEALLQFLNVQFLDINQFTIIFLLGIPLAVGVAAGWPLGVTLGRSAIIHRAPVALGTLLAVISIVFGEVGYVALLLFRFVGIFDLEAAAMLVGEIIAGYSEFWIVTKLVMAIALVGCSVGVAQQRKSIKMNV